VDWDADGAPQGMGGCWGRWNQASISADAPI